MKDISYLDEYRTRQTNSVNTSDRLKCAYGRLSLETIGIIGEETLRQDRLIEQLQDQPIDDAGLAGEIQRS